MSSSPSRALPLLLAASLAAVPLACDKLSALGVGKPTPEKTCEKAVKLTAKSDKGDKGKKQSAKEEKAECIEALTKVQKKSPEAFECFDKCVADADSEKAMKECMTAKCAELLAKAETGDDKDKQDKKTGNAKVDALTPGDITGHLSSEYQHYGYELIKETNNAAGWSANFMLGKKGREAQIYRVMLVKCTSYEDCDKTISAIYDDAKDPKAAWEEGNKQALWVECLSEVSTSSREPGPCYSGGRHDNIVSKLTH